MINLKNKHREKYVYFLRICNGNLLSEMLHTYFSETCNKFNSTEVKKLMFVNGYSQRLKHMKIETLKFQRLFTDRCRSMKYIVA